MCYKDAGDGHCTRSTQQDMHHSRQMATAEEPWKQTVLRDRGMVTQASLRVTCCGPLGNISQRIPLSIIFGSNLDSNILIINTQGIKYSRRWALHRD